MMDWKNEIIEGMKTIKKICANNTWLDCIDCPFGEYCNILENNGYGVPEDWSINKNENS